MGTLSNYHLFPKKKVKHPPCCIITSKLKKWKWKSFLLMGTMLKPVRWETLPKIMCNPSLNKVKLKVGNISDEKKRFCFVYGIIWPQNLDLETICVCSWTCEVWKRKKFCFIYIQKTHSFWNAKRIYSEWRRLLLTSCICTVQPVWEMRIVHLNWTQICKCTSTGFASMKKFFWEKYCIKKVHRL